MPRMTKNFEIDIFLSVTCLKLSSRDNIYLIRKFCNLYLRNNNPQTHNLHATNNVVFLELDLRRFIATNSLYEN